MLVSDAVRGWGAGSRLLHWGAAGLILALLAHGWWMTEFPARDARLGHYATHASLGYALIALMLVRLVWRWTHGVPELPAATPRWERFAAHAAHWGLYALAFGAALSGWALAGTLRRPLDSFFGWFSVPMPVRGGALHEALEEAHELLVWTLALLVAAHIASALYHWLWRGDDVMQRMLP
jgi:cytochrome b561